VRQRCPLSLLLFNIYIEKLVKQAVGYWETAGVRLIKALRFKDELAR